MPNTATYSMSHRSDLPFGGHFAVMEEPALFLEELKIIHCIGIE
jgi:hypothetical protein